MKTADQLTAHAIQEAFDRSNSGAHAFALPGPEPGLYLQFKGGQATWIVRRRQANGSRAPLHIGTWPTISIDVACETARLAKLRFARLYGKPLRQRNVGALLEQYSMERLSSLRSAGTTARSLRQLFEGLADREVRSITKEELGGKLGAMACTAPIHANRCLAYAHAYFNWAIERRYLGSNPAAALQRFIDEPHHVRVLSLEELGQIFRTARSLEYPFGPALELMVLLPFRREVISTMRRDDIVYEGSWRWRRPGLIYKGERGPSVTWRLPDRAGDAVCRTFDRCPSNSPFTFTGNGLTPISGWSRAKRRLDETLNASRALAGLPPIQPWRLDDLRATFAGIHQGLGDGEAYLVNRCLDRIDRFRNPIYIEWACSQDIVDECAPVLENWAAAVVGAST